MFYLLVTLDLHCCERFSLVVASGGFPLAVIHGLLIAVASLVAEQGSREWVSIVVA